MTTSTSHLIVAVGLNVGNSEPTGQYAATLSTLAWLNGARGNGQTISHAVGTSSWEGVEERFVQALIPNGPGPGVKLAELCAVARLLGQSAISFLPPGADRWSLAFADGHHEVGGTLEEYPVIVAR